MKKLQATMLISMTVALPHHIPGIRLLSNLITIRDIEFRMLVCYANNNNDNNNDNIYTTKK